MGLLLHLEPAEGEGMAAVAAVFAAKKQLRKELKSALAAMTNQQRQEESATLTTKVERQPHAHTRAHTHTSTWCTLPNTGTRESRVSQLSQTVGLSQHPLRGWHTGHTTGTVYITYFTEVLKQQINNFWKHFLEIHY